MDKTKTIKEQILKYLDNLANDKYENNIGPIKNNQYKQESLTFHFPFY